MERHRLDPLSLIFGVGFVAAGMTLLGAELDVADLDPRSWWPIPVLFLGGWLLLSALNRTRERDDRLRDDAEAGAADEADAATEFGGYSFDDEGSEEDETEPVVRAEEGPQRPTA